MKSRINDDFRACFAALPKEVQSAARRAFRSWKADPNHPGLRFKRIHGLDEIYSVRVGIGWRAVGYKEGDLLTWFWIGSHADYDRLIS